MTFDDTILALCQFRDTHPQLANHHIALKPGPDDDTIIVLFHYPDLDPPTTYTYILGAPL